MLLCSTATGSGGSILKSSHALEEKVSRADEKKCRDYQSDTKRQCGRAKSMASIILQARLGVSDDLRH
jgi:hypothetical protein